MFWNATLQLSVDEFSKLKAFDAPSDLSETSFTKLMPNVEVEQKVKNSSK